MSKFAQPKKVTGLDLAFGGSMKELLPPWTEIPDEFKSSRSKWCALVSRWFFSGLKGYEFMPADGIDKNDALRHVGAILGSFEPKHEHKEAACAYLMSLWFTDFKEPEKQA